MKNEFAGSTRKFLRNSTKKWSETYLSTKFVAYEEPIFDFYHTDEPVRVQIVYVVVFKTALHVFLLIYRAILESFLLQLLLI